MSENDARSLPVAPVGISLLFTVLAALILVGTLLDSSAGAVVVGILVGLGIAYANGWRPRPLRGG